MDRATPISEVLGRTLPSTSFAKPEQTSRPKPSAKIRSLIAELGLRYRPTSQADLEAHAGALALLCADLADAPPHLLERAIQKHAIVSPYLPKAADLVKLMQESLNLSRPSVDPGKRLDMASIRNGQMDADPTASHDIRWIYDAGGQLQLVPIAQHQAR